MKINERFKIFSEKMSEFILYQRSMKELASEQYTKIEEIEKLFEKTKPESDILRSDIMCFTSL